MPFNGVSTRKDENGNYKKGNPCGMLAVFFDQFPEIEDELERLFLKRGKGPFEKRITIMTLAARMQEMARAAGLKDTQWPLCSSDHGYEAIRRWAKRLVGENPEQFIRARFGRQAAKNLRKGKGEPSVVENLRPLAGRELDFHKVDEACVIDVEDPNGATLCFPMERFHLGIIVGEYPQVVFGYAIVLEATPSARAVLNVMENCLFPSIDGEAKISLTGKGNVVTSALIPELRGNGFSLLKVDNGSSNIALDCVSNIMDVVGCAITFGAPGNWWARPMIENFFGIFTRKTGQQLPSSFGTGPRDPMREEPIETAHRLHISYFDLVDTFEEFIEQYNRRQPSKKTSGQTPVDMIKALLNNKKSGVFPQPLPVENENSWCLLAHTVEATIRGSQKRGERPFIKIDKTVYTSPTMSKDFELVGKQAYVFIHRRNANIAIAITKDDQRYLGRLVPDRDARRHPLPVDMRKMLNAFLRKQRFDLATVGAVRIYVQSKTDEIRTSKGIGGRRASLKLADLHQKIEQMAHDELASKADASLKEQPSQSRISRPPVPHWPTETQPIVALLDVRRNLRQRGRGF
ncbi:hypothetical protein AYM40_10575 [Paraburkholderia phytofirmans OLGA172]|uniref:Integrase catalytic domain-containing protein n=1 Tax=Paraburkholderia phytofirmans OLGA172 TaxID=1417228 RepID=A0A167VYP2_9BURK|nr:hypothetical protein [Paraburkholderia phytofirmans]ANB72757.1 hypothetical protein AYM40_10575 [Paraburkholderia phytofirmans OLGA172]